MKISEARKIGEIVSTADGGCSVCVDNLVELLNKQFPEYDWRIEDGKLLEFPEQPYEKGFNEYRDCDVVVPHARIPRSA